MAATDAREHDVSLALGASGGGEQLTALDQTWTLSPVTLGVVAAFTSWVKGRARQEAIGESTNLAAANQLAYMSAFQQAVAAGTYQWEGSATIAALNELPGFLHLLLLMLRPRHPDITPQQAEAIHFDAPEATAAAVRELIADSFPNRRRGAAKKTPPP